jgi:hypothetical protein
MGTARVKFKMRTQIFVIGVCKRRFETAMAMMEMVKKDGM